MQEMVPVFTIFYDSIFIPNSEIGIIKTTAIRFHAYSYILHSITFAVPLMDVK